MSDFKDIFSDKTMKWKYPIAQPKSGIKRRLLMVKFSPPVGIILLILIGSFSLYWAGFIFLIVLFLEYHRSSFLYTTRSTNHIIFGHDSISINMEKKPPIHLYYRQISKIFLDTGVPNQEGVAVFNNSKFYKIEISNMTDTITLVAKNEVFEKTKANHHISPTIVQCIQNIKNNHNVSIRDKNGDKPFVLY